MPGHDWTFEPPRIEVQAVRPRHHTPHRRQVGDGAISACRWVREVARPVIMPWVEEVDRASTDPMGDALALGPVVK